MNYLMEIKRFYDRQLSQRLSTGQIALWHALMEVNNRCGWQEWFNVRWGTLMEMTDLSKSGLYKALKALEKYNYIEHGERGLYKILSLLETRKETRKETAQETAWQTNSDMTPIIYNKQNKTKQNKTKYELEEELFDSLSVKL